MVRSPRRRRISVYSAQFVTRYRFFGNLWRRAALNLCGIQVSRSEVEHPITRTTCVRATTPIKSWVLVAPAILLRPRLSPSANTTFSNPTLSRQGAPVCKWVKASVNPVASSTSIKISVIRASGSRRYRSRTRSLASSGTSASRRSTRNVPSSMTPPGERPCSGRRRKPF